MSTENELALYDAFAESLQINLKSVTDELTYNSIPEWDSVGHMALVAELEERFGVMLDTNDIIDMSSVMVAKEILARHDVRF